MRGTQLAAKIGLLLHLVVLVFPYSASGLLAPSWGLTLLLFVWAFLLVIAWRIRRTNPRLVLAIPFIAVAAWFTIMTVGDQLLGWTA